MYPQTASKKALLLIHGVTARQQRFMGLLAQTSGTVAAGVVVGTTVVSVVVCVSVVVMTVVTGKVMTAMSSAGMVTDVVAVSVVVSVLVKVRAGDGVATRQEQAELMREVGKRVRSVSGPKSMSRL